MVRKSEPPPGRDEACFIRENGEEYCIDPLDDVIGALAKRWTLLIVAVLGNKDHCRFNEMKRFIPGLTARALSERIEDLQRLRLVARDVETATTPPSVSYRLTPEGRALRKALIPMVRWAAELP